MKGFGFPGQPVGPAASNNTPAYRADTSKQKSELINVLKRSEQLWNDDKTEESISASNCRSGSTPQGHLHA